MIARHTAYAQCTPIMPDEKYRPKTLENLVFKIAMNVVSLSAEKKLAERGGKGGYEVKGGRERGERSKQRSQKKRRKKEARKRGKAAEERERRRKSQHANMRVGTHRQT